MLEQPSRALRPLISPIASGAFTKRRSKHAGAQEYSCLRIAQNASFTEPVAPPEPGRHCAQPLPSPQSHPHAAHVGTLALSPDTPPLGPGYSSDPARQTLASIDRPACISDTLRTEPVWGARSSRHSAHASGNRLRLRRTHGPIAPDSIMAFLSSQFVASRKSPRLPSRKNMSPAAINPISPGVMSAVTALTLTKSWRSSRRIRSTNLQRHLPKTQMNLESSLHP